MKKNLFQCFLELETEADLCVRNREVAVQAAGVVHGNT